MRSTFEKSPLALIRRQGIVGFFVTSLIFACLATSTASASVRAERHDGGGVFQVAENDPAGEKPTGEKPTGEKPADGKPADGKDQGDLPEEVVDAKKNLELVTSIRQQIDTLHTTTGFVTICKNLAKKISEIPTDTRTIKGVRSSLPSVLEEYFKNAGIEDPSERLGIQEPWFKAAKSLEDELKKLKKDTGSELKHALERLVVVLQDAAQETNIRPPKNDPTKPMSIGGQASSSPDAAGLMTEAPKGAVVARFQAARSKYNVPYYDQNPIATATEFKKLYLDLQSKLIEFERDGNKFPDNLRLEHKRRVDEIMNAHPGRKDDWRNVLVDLDNQLGVEIRAGRFNSKDHLRWDQVLGEMAQAFGDTIEELKKDDKAINSGSRAATSGGNSRNASAGQSGSGTHLADVMHERLMSKIYRTHDRRLNRIERVQTRR